MTTASSAPKRLTALFLLAVTGVLVCFGAVIGRALGTTALVVYAVVIVVAVVGGVQWLRGRVQAAKARAARAAGRTCTCCTGSVHDPVQVR